jgi:hypothetical protein
MTPAMVVTGLGVWAPGYENAAAWAARRRDVDVLRPAATRLPARQRRRASELTRAMVTAFSEALAQSGESAAELSTVFGSAYGEGSTLAVLLNQISSADGELSPMRFAGSVHNTASGMLTIACDARGFTTSLAAGAETLMACLQEAAGLLATGHAAVAVVVGDCSPPPELVDAAEQFDTLAVAFVMRSVTDPSSQAPPNHGWVQLQDLMLATFEPGAATLPDTLQLNPCAGALVLADAVVSRAASRVRLNVGPTRAGERTWAVNVSPHEAA